MKTNWFRLLLPVWDMLMTISDDGAGPDQISLNNQQLVREMENNKQSSIEFYAYSHRNLLIELENKKISIGEYVVKHGELFQQAKEKHKQETINAYKKGFLSDDIKLADDYYKQNYGK